jgi:glycosyltransferase involved in cell wall biosynthesis
MNLKHYIDVPDSWALEDRYLRMRGWCFCVNLPLRSVRLRLNSGLYWGRYGTHRPDVRSTYSEAPDNYVGFELWTILPPGEHNGHLEFQDGDSRWHTATRLNITVPIWVLPRWFPTSAALNLVHFQMGARPTHQPRAVASDTFPSNFATTGSLPRFTIVTPSFNQGQFLDHTIASVLGQDGVDVAYVVQDGGSGDSTLSILKHYSDRLTRWKSGPDQGQSDAIALGFRDTQGAQNDVMAWLNSDDVYLPSCLLFVAQYFARHPEIDVLYGHRILINEQSEEIGRWFLPKHDTAMLRMNDYVPQETMFWRRRIWDKVGGIDPSFKFAMDWDLLLRFQAAGAKIVRVPYFLACFRIHAAQKTSAQMESVGQKEIDALRLRTFGRVLSPAEIESNPRLIRYLRKSAWIEFLWRRFGIRHP